MRPETQKQIVKAFSMMYEDTDMPLEELIEKLQQLSGTGSRESETKKYKQRSVRGLISDAQILDAMESGTPLRQGLIRDKLPQSISREAFLSRLNTLAKREKIVKQKVNSRLCLWTKT